MELGYRKDVEIPKTQTSSCETNMLCRPQLPSEALQHTLRARHELSPTAVSFLYLSCWGPLCLPTHNPPDPVTLASTGRSQSKAKWDEEPPSSGQDTETETGRNPVWTPRALPHDSNLHFRFYAVNPLPPTVCASADPMNQVQPQF